MYFVKVYCLTERAYSICCSKESRQVTPVDLDKCCALSPQWLDMNI